ncbi:MAG: alanine--tRNA ligase [Acidimicrobiales bacterium]|jgi:alanyl-tRNA synthetase|nr:alanine--tRNA ligase [Acidimicrobiales bacterium]MDP6910191.1 alanine--tRNA ligase [Acidimicrobiales bacterium]
MSATPETLPTAAGLRRAFVDFFIENGHHHEASGSLIPHDPTLLFTVAGMVPFKPYFVGEQPAPWDRAVTVQKCVRAGGKHNDLDEVGRTSRHLTFFEMMGNFSFGDYFKSQACAFAWEFVTDVLGLDPERLWITVHVSDDEAEAIWRDEVGVPAERIQRLDEDNYWRMADTGPCGPCSEIFWDKGPAFGDDGGPAHGDDERFIEIWNLVFMQFEQHDDGSMTELPAPSIDTGAGLERILSVLGGVDSVWETDEFDRLLTRIGELSGIPHGSGDRTDVSQRILADHARSSTFMISDGVFPSNEDRGYVLRRIIRRAVRHAWLLGVEDQVMPELVDAVVGIMGPDYPELVRNHAFVRDVLDREEHRFRETLRTGSVILDEALDGLADGGRLDGDVAFKLHDTYGFPLELTEEITAERGLGVDLEGFRAAMADQQTRARSARKSAGGSAAAGDLRAVLEEHGATTFVGREVNEATATVLYADDDVVVLDRTPFYAESGGQIGDTGTLVFEGGTLEVFDTTLALDGLHRHHIQLPDASQSDDGLAVGQEVRATIDIERRAAIRRNHTGTHLLHSALRRVLGDHVKQQGSHVGPDRLRFDFSHFEALTAEQMTAVEDLANADILANPSCNHYETSKDEAEAAGAIAFFGDKYGDTVRVLEAGPHSTELCGGTHVSALGDIGPIRIVAEGSIGSNIRRIEALTGTAPIERLRDVETVLGRAAELVGVPVDDVLDGIEKRLAEARALRGELAGLRTVAALGRADELAESAEDGLVVALIDGIDRDGLRQLAMAVRDRDGVRAVVLGAAPEGGGAALVAAVATGSGLDAGALVAEAARTIGGGGRPNPEVTAVGGKAPERLAEALEQARAAAQAG